jgi:hypothetical protein
MSNDATSQSVERPNRLSKSRDAAGSPKEHQPVDEPQNSPLAGKEQESDIDSESSEREHVDFKRRKIQSKKSSIASMSAISNLKFSFGKSQFFFFLLRWLHLI